MRGLDDSTEVILRVSQSAGEQVKHGWHAFVNFAARDNVLEVALGLMLGSSCLLSFTIRTSWTNAERGLELPMPSRKS